MNRTSYEDNVGVTGAGEGKMARAIESRTSKLPSDVFLWAAAGSILVSMFLESSSTFGRTFERAGGRFWPRSRRAHLSLFVGQWAPTFLLLGVYNKIVKVLGSQGR